jgi:pimeloyl-ACP methyl ester carboxylesterase
VTPYLRSHLGVSLAGFHHCAYWEWGSVDAERTVVCVHGLSRQGRDFDVLARALVRKGWRVVCPDLVGRGMSDWLRDPDGYTLLQYGADINALIARLDVDEIDYVGTSLGGLVGIMLAGQPETPIRRLVVNDIGPFIPGAALRRIGAYLNATPPYFADMEEALDHFRLILAPYGNLTNAQWHHLVEHSIRRDPEGGYLLRCDPAIGEAYRPWRLGSITMWEHWDKVHCPTLLLRGMDSDLLLASTADEMTQRGPRAHLVEFKEIGHVPSLLLGEQIAPIVSFLSAANDPA